jgi:outer membrane autotransporter protein
MTSKYLAKPDRLLRSSFKRLAVSTAILTVLGLPAAAQVIADGTNETVAPGTVIDTGTQPGAANSGFWATNNGSIRADGPLSITTGGYAANGITAEKGGQIDVKGAVIKTTGILAFGVGVSHGAHVIATDVSISTEGPNSHGVLVYYTGSTYTQNGGSVSTTGNSAVGFQIRSGGTADITDVDVSTAGASSHGVDLANAGSSFQIKDSRITSAGNDAIGVKAANNALADLIGTTIETSGAGAHGVQALSGAVINGTNVDVTTHGKGAHGLFASGGQINLDQSRVVTTGDSSFGVLSDGAGSDVSVTNSFIETAGYGSLATRAQGGGHLSISDSVIKSTGTYGHGLQAFQGGSADIENSIIETQGDTAYGLDAEADSQITANNVMITTHGPRAKAIVAGVGSHVSVDTAIINTAGYGSHGLYTSGGTIDADNVDIATSGPTADGVYASAGTINLSNSRVTTHGSYNSGLTAFYGSGRINAKNVEVNVDNPTTAGVQAGYGGQVTLDTVSVTGTNGSTGLTTTYGGTITGSNVAVEVSSLGDNKAIGMSVVGGNSLFDLTNSSVTASGEGATGLYVVTDGQAALHMKGSVLDVKDGTAIDVASSNLDVDLDGSSVVGKQILNVNEYTGTGDPRIINVKATNGSYLEGDVHVAAGEGQHAAISLDQGSVLKGATDGLHELGVANKSVWQITGDSNVGTLLNDNGTVAFGADGAFKTLTVGSLESRNGSFLFNSKLNEGGAATETDKLVVTGDTTGDGKFFIANRGGQGAVTGTGATDGIKLTDIGGVSNGTFELGAAAVVGIYDYKLVKADGQDWYLQTEGEDPVDPVDPGCEETGTCPPPGGHIVDTVPGYNIALASAQEHVLTTLDTFHERVGELRSEEMSEGFHAWTRGIGKTGSYSPKVNGYNGHGFDMTTGGVQIGGDYSLGGVFIPGDKLTLGVFGEYAHSNFNVRGRTASGSISSKGVGAYATWQQHVPTDTKPGTGAYVDAVVKQDWLDFGVEAKSVSGFAIGHSYSGKATSASIETGYGFDLGNNVVLQPQAQLSYSKITADNFTDGNGIAVHGQEAESLRGRLGIRLEKTFFFGDDGDEQVYLMPVPEKAAKGKAKTKGKMKTKVVVAPAKKKKFVKSVTTFVDGNVKHEFKGRNGLHVADTAIGSDMRGTRYDIGVGAEAKVAKNVSFFGRASVEFGGSTDVAGKVTGGLKITW